MTSGPWETNRRDEFRLRFDEDVDVYDRTRPVAPVRVFDDVVRRAGLGRGSTVVEIGPGTGQATRSLAERGLRILALEIGTDLAARARENLADLADVTVRTTSFEAWDPGDEIAPSSSRSRSSAWEAEDRDDEERGRRRRHHRPAVGALARAVEVELLGRAGTAEEVALHEVAARRA